MKLKYCGIHSSEDVALAAASSCDYLGFVFAKSRRMVTIEQALSWLQTVDLGSKKTVALFVNEPLEQLKQVVREQLFDVIQLHGNESPAFARELKQGLRTKVWKAIHHGEGSLDAMQAYEGCVDGYVVDCRSTSAWGGTGKSFDWSEVPRYLAEANRQNVPVFIAGGVKPENVANLSRYKPDGIDVSSGIEVGGRKDKKRMKALEKGMGKAYGKCANDAR